MREPVTAKTMLPQLARLNSVFTKYKLDDLHSLAIGYAEACEDLDTEAVGGAVALAIKEEPRFPVPSKLRELAKRWIQTARPALVPALKPVDEQGPQPVCRVCSSMPRLAWLEGQVYKGGRMTDETFQHKRYIAPCNERLHTGSGYVPYPPNFLGWADA